MKILPWKHDQYTEKQVKTIHISSTICTLKEEADHLLNKIFIYPTKVIDPSTLTAKNRENKAKQNALK